LRFETTAAVLFVVSAYAAVIAGAEYLRRRGWPALMTRKSAHAAGALVSCALPVFISRTAAISIGGGASLLLWATGRNNMLRGIHDGGRDSAGAVLFPAGLALSALFFWKSDAAVFQWSALLFGLADGVAGAGGEMLGRRNYSLTGPKTLEGSLLCLAASVLVLAAFVQVQRGFGGAWDVAAVAAGALAVTAVESALGKGWDNVGVPVAGGAVLLLLR